MTFNSSLEDLGTLADQGGTDRKADLALDNGSQEGQP
jgi:hypothetical protein